MRYPIVVCEERMVCSAVNPGQPPTPRSPHHAEPRTYKRRCHVTRSEPEKTVDAHQNKSAQTLRRTKPCLSRATAIHRRKDAPNEPSKSSWPT
jgi:hypothetical protein